MLKKALKLAVAAALIAGFSPAVMAEINFAGDVAEYIGQYNSGAEDYSAHFQEFGEAHLKANYKQDKISAYLEIEMRDDQAVANNINNAQRRISYQAMDDLTVTMGTIVNSYGVCYGKNSGLATTRSKSYGDYLCLPAYTEADGIQATYNLAAIKGKVQLGILPTYAGTDNGQAMAFGFDAQVVDMLSVRFGYLSVVQDDYTTSADDATTDTANNIGVKATFAGDMSVSLDITSAEAGATKAKTAFNVIQFSKNSLGPGGITVSLATEASDVDGTKTTTNTYTTLMYEIGLGDKAAVDFFYLSKAAKNEGSGDTVTASNIGGGLVVKF